MEIFLIRLLSIFLNQYSLLLFEFILLTSFLIFILITDKYIPNKSLVILILSITEIIILSLLVGNALFNTYRFTHPNEDYFYNYYDNPPIADYYKEV